MASPCLMSLSAGLPSVSDDCSKSKTSSTNCTKVQSNHYTPMASLSFDGEPSGLMPPTSTRVSRVRLSHAPCCFYGLYLTDLEGEAHMPPVAEGQVLERLVVGPQQ